MIKTQVFDVANHLDNPEVIVHYLADAFRTRDSKTILQAIQDVARARSMGEIAHTTGPSRPSR